MGGTIYVLAGGKGGVGRTTTALNTGIALEQAGYNTVVVDGDVAMTGLTNLLEPETESGVHGILAGTDSINDAVADGPAGLTIVPGKTALDSLEGIDEAKLGRVVEPLAAAHDVVLVDTAPGLGPLHRDAYARADGTVLVTTTDEQAVAAVEKTATVVEEEGGEVVGTAVTMTDEQGARDTIERVDTEALAVIPESETIGSGAPGVEADEDAAAGFERLASAIGALADGEPIESVGDDASEESAATERTTETAPTTIDSDELDSADEPAGGDESAGDEQPDTERDDGVAATATKIVADDSAESEDFEESEEPDESKRSTDLGASDESAGEDPLDRVFDDDYGSDGTDDRVGARLRDLPKRISDSSSAEAVVERLQDAASTRNGDGNPVQALRERLSREDEDPEEVDLSKRLQERETRIEPSGDTEEDPLDKLFTDNN